MKKFIAEFKEFALKGNMIDLAIGMIIAIGLVGVSYTKWLRWSWKLFVAEFAFSALMMIFMVAINYN